MRTWLLAARTSPARFLFPVLLGFQLCVLFYFADAQWRTEWRWAIDWAGAAISLIGPVLAGYAVWRSQYVRSRFGELVGAAKAGPRAYAFDFLGSMTWAAGSHLVTVVVACVSVLLVGASGVPPVIALVWQLAALAGYLGLGYAAGQLSRSRLLPPVVAIALFFASVQSSNGSLPTLWFEVGGATASLAGLSWSPRVVLAQTLVGVTLALVPFVVARPLSRVAARMAGGLVAAVVVVVSLSTLASAGQDRFTYQSDHTTRVCSGSDPQVCMLRENAGAGAAVSGVLHALSVAAGGQDAGVPSTFVQALGGRPTDHAGQEFVLNGGTVSAAGVDPAELAHYFVWNRDCLWGDEAPPVEARTTLDQLQQLLLARAGVLERDTLPGDVTSLLGQPEPAQRVWIAQTLAASRSCSFDQLRPWGP